jgi:hypothetical protein
MANRAGRRLFLAKSCTWVGHEEVFELSVGL